MEASMSNYFDSPFMGKLLSEQVTNPNIIVGRYSYYSGYYHGHSFDDCARYLSADAAADKLIVGSFCSIASGASFMMAGTQGKPIRKHFADDAIAMLLEMAWWDWPLERIRDAMPLLCGGDIPALHRYWQEAVRQA
jgi:hypothetical protein